jgi:hypothetical protein
MSACRGADGKWNNIRVFVVRGVIDEEGSEAGPKVGGRRRGQLFQIERGVHGRGGDMS